MFFLKKNTSPFVVKDGIYKNYRFDHSRGYAIVPDECADRFDEQEVVAPAKFKKTSPAKGKTVSEKEGEK